MQRWKEIVQSYPADDMPIQLIVKINYFKNIIYGIIINAISYSIDSSIYSEWINNIITSLCVF
jgi:hypothetical protein